MLFKPFMVTKPGPERHWELPYVVLTRAAQPRDGKVPLIAMIKLRVR